MKGNRRGFTIIEVLVAVLILSVGLMALAGTAGLVTRMIAQGHIDTEASAIGSQRMEILRSQPCVNIASGNETLGPFAVRWVVASTANGRARTVLVQVSQPTMRGSRVRNYQSTIFC